MLRGRVDLVVVGAGIVGLAHAVEAVERDLSVIVVEQNSAQQGASVRNFGHVYLTAQSGSALEYAFESRERWLHLSRAAGFWLRESGTLLAARSPDELDVIHEFAREREHAHALSASAAADAAPVAGDVLGALWTPLDLRVDPRSAVSAISSWLATQPGVTFSYGTNVLAVESGGITTNRGEIDAEGVVVAVGHDLDRLLPDQAEDAGVRRCTLQMLRVRTPTARLIEPALATGLALLRYSGFRLCPSLPVLRERYERERPDLLREGVNLLVTQLPDGDLILGDTHTYGASPEPFRSERLDLLLLEEGARLLGVDYLTVVERWQGVYADAPDHEFLVSTPAEGVSVVAVTSGIGMTTALGLAPRVLDQLFDQAPTTV